MSVRSKRLLQRLLVDLVIAVCLVFFLGPVLWAIFNSFKTSEEIFTWPPSFIPRHWTLEQYQGAIAARDVVTVFFNSFFVSIITIFLSLLMGFLAAYPMARRRTKGFQTLLSLILVGRMIPAVALAVPVHFMFSKMGIVNTRMGLIICYTMFCLPFSIFLLSGFIQQIPLEIEEAARIDGCGKLQILYQIIFPLSKAGLGVAAIFNFLLGWNDLFFAVVLTSSAKIRTIPIAIVMFQTDRNTNFGQLYAFMALGMIPAILFAVFAQRYLVEGITMGAVKG